jgi:transcriptional regulator with XRE-family HTH domain
MAAFDLAGALRRVRRIADLSQRELAQACGLSQSAIAQAETGRRDLPVSVLVTVVEVAGLRLVLMTGDGQVIEGMAADTVRDLAGRRFPAHLDTRPSDDVPGLYEPRPDRPETAYTFGRDRAGRDRSRCREGTPDDHHPYRPGDTPWERKVARRQAARQRQQEAFERLRAAGQLPPIEEWQCSCPPRCEELDDYSGRPVHAPDCPCVCDVA